MHVMKRVVCLRGMRQLLRRNQSRTRNSKNISTTWSLMEVFESTHHEERPKLDFFSYVSADMDKIPNDTMALSCGASDRSLTYGELFEQSKQLGISLQERGYRKGATCKCRMGDLTQVEIDEMLSPMNDEAAKDASEKAMRLSPSKS